MCVSPTDTCGGPWTRAAVCATPGCPTGVSWRWWRPLCRAPQPMSRCTLPRRLASVWSMTSPVQVRHEQYVWCRFDILCSKSFKRFEPELWFAKEILFGSLDCICMNNYKMVCLFSDSRACFCLVVFMVTERQVNMYVVTSLGKAPAWSTQKVSRFFIVLLTLPVFCWELLQNSRGPLKI